LIFVSNSAFIPAKSVTELSEIKASKNVVNPTFNFYRIHRQGKDGVTATWGLDSETGVSGFSVEKTYEDPTDPYAYWETIASTPATGERSYKVTDTGVFPGFISYRVVVIMNDGTEMASDYLTIRILSH
ncbi:MAG TPA: hypothetical protein PLU37_09880, partial [Chitinophagaceae bacterium]|nr:hypothetical protein [Chitinophagaceae bacterium]